MTAPSSDQAGIRQIIRALHAAKHRLVNVQNGEDTIPVRTETEAIKNIMDVDDAFLVVRMPDGDEGWVRFVMGNDPDEVVCDHTVNLSPVIDPVTHGWWE